jgi:arginyl-tRNA synthetase
MMELIREDLAVLGVHQKVFTSERRLVEAGMVEDVLNTLEDMGHIYTGVLEPPKGKMPEDWEPRPQTLFRATAFGDDVDRPLKKSDGSWTYFASDIANHLDKFRRGFANMIDVWGADHAGYVKRMKAAVKAITAGKGELDVKICQIVRLMDKGAPMKMSKRAGTFVTLRDLVDEVGQDIVRFHMLTRKNDAQMDFDLTAVTETSRENPIWYVQYASARCHSSMREAAKQFPNHDISLQSLVSTPISCLTDDSELGLIRMIAGWPRLVEAAADAHEPHRIAYYLYELAALLHGFWDKGNRDPGFRIVLEDNEELTMARLVLVQGVQTVIDSGLGIFGIQPVEELR